MFTKVVFWHGFAGPAVTFAENMLGTQTKYTDGTKRVSAAGQLNYMGKQVIIKAAALEIQGNTFTIQSIIR